MGKKIFVGNLPYSMSSDEVRELFEPFGPVASAKVVSDRETGQSRGFAFVEMQAPDAAQKAIQELDGKPVAGRNLAVREAHDQSPGGRSGPGGGRGPGGPGGRREGRGNFGNRY